MISGGNRKKTNSAYNEFLQKSEIVNELYKSVFENASDGILLANIKTKKFLFGNPKILQMLGVTEKELLTMGVRDIHPPKDIPRVIQNFEELAKGKIATAKDVPVVRRDGKLFYTDIKTSLINLNGETYLAGTFRDVTERKKAEDQLRANEKMYLTFLDSASNAGIGVVIVQDKDSRKAAIYGANEKALEMSGYTLQEATKLTLYDVFPPEEIETLLGRYYARQKGLKEPGRYEATLVRKDKTRLTIAISPAVIELNGKPATVSFMEDISERKKIEELLHQSEEKFRSIFDKSPIGIVTVDKTMHFTSANESFCKMMGLTEEELKQRTVAEITPKEYIRKDIEAARNLIEGKISVYKGEEYYFIKKDKSIIWLSFNVTVVRDKQDNFLYFLTMFDDITKQKNAEMALQDSEKKYRQLVELSPDGIFMHSENKMTYVNARALSLFGAKDPSEVVGHPVLDFVDKRDKAWVAKRIGRMYAGKSVPVFINERLNRVDGTAFDTEISSAPITYGGKPAAQGVIRDVTERIKKDQELKKNYSILDSVINSTADGLLVIDLDGKVEEFNESFQKLWHIPQRIIDTKDDKKLLAYVLNELKDPKEFLRKVNHLYKHPTKEDLSTIHFKDGRVFERYSRPQVSDGKIIGRVWSFRDVTKREKALENLEIEDARMKGIFESMVEGVFVADLKGKILMANKKAEQMLNWNNDVLGHEYYNFPLLDKYGNKIPTQKRPLMQTLKTGKPQMFNDGAILINGEKIDIWIIASPIVINGKMIGAMAVFRDVRKEKEIERAKSDFVSIASHQLRTPLTISKWYIESLESQNLIKENQSKAKEYLDIVQECNERLINLIGDLLSVSRIEQGRVKDFPQRTDLGELTRGVISNLQTIAGKKHINIDLQISDKDIIKMIDQERLKEMLEVLISNAIKYSKTSGKVKVILEKLDNLVKFTIEDNGIGISDEDKRRIFDKFFRSAKAVELDPDGTGLGLYVAKSYVENWGGKIWFESKPGVRTDFYFTLPLK